MSRPRSKLSKQDVDIARRAKAAAGGPAKLGQLFGVSKQAASEWGRVRPIPRHVRSRLEQVVASGADVNVERAVEDPPWRLLGSQVTGTGLQLPPPADEYRSSRGSDTWRAMTAENKNGILNYVRQAALIAMAVQQLLKDDSAHKVIATLNAEVNAHVNNELLLRSR